MKQRVSMLLMAIVLALPLARAEGADAPSKSEADSAPDATAHSTDDATKETQAQERQSADVFVPTEEISEDAAVAFPVDI